MNEVLTAIDRLLEESNELKNGPERIGVLEEAIRIADEHGELDAGFRARLKLMEAATFSGRPDILLAAFSRCVAEHDRDPDRFDRNDLLWKYKWVVAHTVEFPHIPRSQIESMLADMEIRFKEAGSTLHAVHQARREILADMGDMEGARSATADLAATKRDWLSDCRACVCNITAGQLADQQRDAEALAEAAPILAGRLKCTHVPHFTYARLLLPLLRLGRIEQALEYHRIGYQLIGENPEFLLAASGHLEFLVLIDSLDDALVLMQAHLPHALSAPSVYNRMRFYGAVWMLLARLVERDRRSLRLRFPPTFSLFDSRAAYETAVLQEWFGKEAEAMAEQFDRRNGNSHYARWLTERRQLLFSIKTSIARPLASP